MAAWPGKSWLEMNPKRGFRRGVESERLAVIKSDKESSMLRIFVCAVLALLLGAGVSLAGKGAKKGKKGHAVAGTVKIIDAAGGTLTITTKKKKVQEDKEFKIGDTAKVVVVNGTDKKELSGKDGLKSIKEGDKVRVQADEAGNVVSIQVGDFAKKGKKAKKANK
jgi:hypothetical protein